MLTKFLRRLYKVFKKLSTAFNLLRSHGDNPQVDQTQRVQGVSAETLAIAFHHFQTGRISEAEELYKEILQQDPEQPIALHWLGVIAYQSNRIEQGFNFVRESLAINPNDANTCNSFGVMLLEQGNLDGSAIYFQQAISLNPKHVFALRNLGEVLHRQGHVDAAIQNFESILAINPNDVVAQTALGQIFQTQGRREEAILHYQQVIRMNPNNLAVLTNLSNLLREQGQLSDAIQILQRAFSINPNYAPLHNSFGLAFLEQGNLVLAEAHLRQAIALDRNEPDFHHNLGLILHQQNKLDEAIQSYSKATVLDPTHTLAHVNLSNLLQEQGKFGEAVFNLRKAITLNPHTPSLQTSLGIALLAQDNLAEAIAWMQQVVNLDPNNAQAHYNLATVLAAQGNYAQAIESCRKAIELAPNYPEAHIQLAYALLVRGDLYNGFHEFEWRWQVIEPSTFSKPAWDGSSLQEKTILLWVEAGFGDNIQFVRYVPLIKHYGGKVILSCSNALKRLFETISGIDQLVIEGDSLPDFHVHTSLMNLPKIIGTTLENIPNSVPYLSPSKDCRVKFNPSTSAMLHVGLVWASGYKNDRMGMFKSYQQRSCPLDRFEKLLAIDDISFYSLQVGHDADQMIDLEMIDLENNSSLQDLSPAIHDFADTADLITQMDLIISVDTAVAHLAGALGRPVWVLLPFVADWRWLQDREDSPWYPTMRLFRQKSVGDWDGVITRVVNAVKELLETKNYTNR